MFISRALFFIFWSNLHTETNAIQTVCIIMVYTIFVMNKFVICYNFIVRLKYFDFLWETLNYLETYSVANIYSLFHLRKFKTFFVYIKVLWLCESVKDKILVYCKSLQISFLSTFFIVIIILFLHENESSSFIFFLLHFTPFLFNSWIVEYFR